MSRGSSSKSTASASSADSTPKIVKNVKSTAQDCFCCLTWLFKICLLILCAVIIFFSGRKLYEWFTAEDSKGETKEKLNLLIYVVTFFSTISVAFAIAFENLCTLLMVLIGLIINLGIQMYTVLLKEKGTWKDLFDKKDKDMDNQFSLNCALTGTFVFYILLIYFAR